MVRLRLQWEEDLGTPIPEADWEIIVERTPTVSQNACFKLINYYILNRAYLIAVRIRRYFQSEEAACPRCGEREANILHMFWECPILSAFREEVLKTVETVTDREIPHTPSHCLLGWFPHIAKTKVTGKFQDLA